jgi:hypothetical protein
MKIKGFIVCLALATLVLVTGCGGGNDDATGYFYITRVIYYSSPAHTTIIGYHTNEFDSRGIWVGQTGYNSTGADGIWFTSDDVINRYYHVDGDENGVRTGKVSTAPGGDGIWGTSDDISDVDLIYRYNDGVTTAIQIFAIDNASVAEFNSRGLLIKAYQSTSFGVDGLWGTEDDTVNEYEIITPKSNFYSLKRVVYSTGADQKIGGSDDVQIGYKNCSFAGQIPTIFITYNNTGGDGLWETSDDVVSEYEKYTLLGNGITTRSFTYTGPGVDGTWFTSDDIASSSTDYDFNTNGTFSTYASGSLYRVFEWKEY